MQTLIIFSLFHLMDRAEEIPVDERYIVRKFSCTKHFQFITRPFWWSFLIGQHRLDRGKSNYKYMKQADRLWSICHCHYSYHCVEMVFRWDENAAIDRQTSGNANLSVIKYRLFTCKYVSKYINNNEHLASIIIIKSKRTIRFDFCQGQFLVTQAQLVGSVQLDRFGCRTDRLT